MLAVPELRIYQVWEKPIGPHPVAMFEVNLFNPGMELNYPFAPIVAVLASLIVSRG